METELRYPVLDVDLDAVRSNAAVIGALCARYGIGMAGVIKFSDGSVEIAKAYRQGGCRQIASSRVVHLKRIKEAMPDTETMLIRSPLLSEVSDVVRWADISLNSEASVLRALDAEAERIGTTHGVILMLDVGDRREGVADADSLVALAEEVETGMEHLRLAGVGSSFACVSGVLPDRDNLGVLAEAAERVEKAIGRKLEIVSGGSSITLTLLAAGKEIPSKINHLRIGGAIANPVGIRKNRGVVIEGLREDTFSLAAEIIEVQKKPSPIQGAGKNWAGKSVEFEDRGIPTRALAALGSQDIGDAAQLMPEEAGITVVGGSSDHTVLDVTDSEKDWKAGDTVRFRMFYMPLLYCFATRHVTIRYR